MRQTVREIIGIACATALTFGVYQIYAPAGWIVGGAFGIAWCVLDGWGED